MTDPDRPTDVSKPCPACGNGGPHAVLADDADPQFAHRLPLHCVNCSTEFLFDAEISASA